MDVVGLLMTAIFSPIITWGLRKIQGTGGLTTAIHTLVCVLLYLGWITWSSAPDHQLTPEIVNEAVKMGMATSAAVMTAVGIAQKAAGRKK